MELNITAMASHSLLTARSNHRVALDGLAYSIGESAFGNILVARLHRASAPSSSALGPWS